MTKSMKNYGRELRESKVFDSINIDDSKWARLRNKLDSIWRWAKPQMLLITTLLGVVLGIGIGMSLRPYKCENNAPVGTDGCTITEREIFFLQFPGDLLINLLKMIILPLIMTSLIASLCRMSKETSSKMGGITIVIFLITTVISVLIATVLSLTIKPGKGSAPSNTTGDETEAKTLETILDIFRNLCPRSIVESSFLTAITTIQPVEKMYIYNSTNGMEFKLYNMSMPVVMYKDGMNAIGIIAFSLAFGAILSVMKGKAEILRDLNDVIMSVIMVMVNLILWYSPVGILFLLLAKMIEIDDLAQLWGSLGLYIVVDVVASIIHAFVVLPILMIIVTRRNPFVYYYKFLQAVVTAFATASSGATLAVSFHCAEQKAGVDNRISRFVLPLGATIHMDGTAIYEMCSAIFLAQMSGIKLNAGKVLVAVLMSCMAAISSAGIPQGAIVNLVMVLGAIGVPTTEIRILYATDWLLDRIRTSLNVLGDCLSCVVLQQFLVEDLARMDDENGANEDSKSIFESGDDTTELKNIDRRYKISSIGDGSFSTPDDS